MTKWSWNKVFLECMISIFLFLLVPYFIYANEESDNDINLIMNEYGVSELRYIDNELEIVNYIYECFLERKVAAIVFTGIVDKSKIKEFVEEVFLIDDVGTVYDAEGLWGIMDSYEVSIIYEHNVSYIFLKMKYINTKEEMELFKECINNTIDELESKYQINNCKDVEKARIVHDYLVEKFDYDKGLNNTNDYIGMLSGKMVCQGYALLYCKLMNLLGIKCKIVFSSSHSWNVIEIDKQWYQVDVSGDDFGYLGIQVPRYNNFFKKKLVGQKYEIIKPEIYFWNQIEFSNIVKVKDIIVYRITKCLLFLCIIVLLIFLMYLIFVLPTICIITRKRKKSIAEFEDYNSI